MRAEPPIFSTGSELMTETTAPVPETAGGEPNLGAQGGESGGASAGAESTSPSPEALSREVADLRDRLLRALAEVENQRRRAERDVADTRAYSIAAFARDILTVGDNMRRALDAVAKELKENPDPGIKALIDGVELTERELVKALAKHGVTKLEPLAGKFDPNVHQAMYEVPDPSVPAGTVVQVVQPGYMIGERVLRPALVAVAKGGPKGPGGPTNADSSAANDNATAAGRQSYPDSPTNGST
jgi:molecular chaperone GrpE